MDRSGHDRGFVMTQNPPHVFSEREVITLDLPLAANTRLLHPDAVMVKINGHTHDVGAYCYTLRSDKTRKPNKSRQVVLNSLRKERIPQIRQVIKVASMFIADKGMRPATADHHLSNLKVFMDWADANGCRDCLAGGETTITVYQQFVKDVEERYRRQEFESSRAFFLQQYVLKMLEAITGLTDLGKGIRIVRTKKLDRSGGTEPANQHDFAHALALNDALFQGLFDLILGEQKFPFKLTLPKSLGWEQSFLYVFPTSRWFLAPHQWGEAREKLLNPCWVYDYELGKLADPKDIAHHYSIKGPRDQSWGHARAGVKKAAEGIRSANSDPRNHHRRMLAMAAHNAFFFLFLANTSGNQAVVAAIETDGTVDETTANPGYRSTKWRAQGKEITLVVPVAFVPALRRFMDLRRYLLDGKDFPYLFLALGTGKRDQLAQIGYKALETQYQLLRRIDPRLPRMSARRIRATVLDYYRQQHDAAISAAVGQHTQATADKKYDAGTESAQHVELSLLMEKVATKAQQVVTKGTVIANGKVVEEGGVCTSYGQPAPMGANVPVQPNCKSGCLFCVKRVLKADEEDTRKVASAAYLMEQLILGPLSEAEFRPQIAKCDEDLAKIAAFDGCAEMVARVKQDVYENGNLAPFFADKFQLFLTLGVL